MVLCQSHVTSLLYFAVLCDEKKRGDWGSTRFLTSEALRVELQGAEFPQETGGGTLRYFFGEDNLNIVE